MTMCLLWRQTVVSVCAVFVSPLRGASHFSCFAKKSNQKKATPEGPVACGDCPALLGRPGGCATRPCGETAWAQTVLADSPRPSCVARRPQRGPQLQHRREAWRAYCFDFAFELGSPLGPPRSAACLGAVREHCLRERGDRVAQRPRHASIAGQSRSDRPLRGRPVVRNYGFAYFLLAKQKKVRRPSGRNPLAATRTSRRETRPSWPA